MLSARHVPKRSGAKYQHYGPNWITSAVLVFLWGMIHLPKHTASISLTLSQLLLAVMLPFAEHAGWDLKPATGSEHVVSLSDTDSDSESDENEPEPEPGAGAGPSNANAGGGVAAAEPQEAARGGAGDRTALRQSQRARRPPEDFWVVKRPRINLATALEPLDQAPDPLTADEALAGPDAELWRKAMDEEMQSLLENKTWTLEELPPGVLPIPVKWVFKIKRDGQGNIERYKARLVAKGFKQRAGIDFNEVFAPVSKHITLRALLGLVATENWELHHLDIKTAFLNGTLEESIYMVQPPGYEQGGVNIVCHLQKSLYGLKQAPRAWHTRLTAELNKMGFESSNADPSLFYRRVDGVLIFLLVYVDDILIASSKISLVNEAKAGLKKEFDVRDLGAASYFLGMVIERDRQAGTVKLSQHKLSKELIERFGMVDAKPKSTPLSVSTRLDVANENDEVLSGDYPYAELVGGLLYLSVCTRPDISQAVGALARFMSKPTQQHWTAAKGVLRYLAGTIDFGIIFGAGEPGLSAYCDADYAGDISSRRSTTGYVFILNGGAISWNSRLQPTVAVSTVEAEYMAAAAAVKEALWLRVLFTSLGMHFEIVTINCDNQGAIKLLKHPIASQRSKHIDIIYHFAREHVMRKNVSFEYCATEDMVADIFTKAVAEGKFVFCRSMMGIIGG